MFPHPTPTTPIASLLSLAGPDLIISILILALMALPIVIVIALVKGASKSRTNPLPPAVPPPLPHPPSVSERMEELNLLREKGLITQAEFEEQRLKILSEV